VELVLITFWRALFPGMNLAAAVPTKSKDCCRKNVRRGTNAAVAPRLHPENNCVWRCHEATKLTPRCLVVVDDDDNGELP
jgi:hypothetical protein